MQTMSDYWIDKAAVVTGGARGRGASLAQMLVQAGAHVHVIDALPASDAAWRKLEDACSGTPGSLTRIEADVSRAESWESAGEKVKASGRPLFGLVNNAGTTGLRATVTKTELAEWEKILSINLTGPFLGIKTLAPLMQSGASIVNISSTVGMTGYHAAAYSTSKWALRGLTRSAALELAARKIRVNCVMPGVVDTEMVRSNTNALQALQSIIPVQEMAAPEEIAQVVFFLLGPQASYITGADLAVDGGVTGGGIYWGVGRTAGVL
jgi:NAD(P)-dependent dehydrogenase (short-subunit alcohol dehydrogenase family)